MLSRPLLIMSTVQGQVILFRLVDSESSVFRTFGSELGRESELSECELNDRFKSLFSKLC